ncbi:MAG: methyltransferase domain-containing protein [Candidatus Omnitrophota bacterium]
MGILRKILSNKPVSRKLTLFLLKAHSKIYALISECATFSEGGLHPKHRLMNYHDFFSDNVGRGDRVLDLGCGNGALSFDVAKKAKSVKAIDMNKEGIESCRKKYGKDNIEYIAGDIEKMEWAEKFDAALLSNVLEHIEKRAELLRKLSGITDKLIVRVPMLDRDWVALYKKELGLPYLLDVTHKTEYTLDSFVSELKDGGFSVEKCSIRFGEIWAVCRRFKNRQAADEETHGER